MKAFLLAFFAVTLSFAQISAITQLDSKDNMQWKTISTEDLYKLLNSKEHFQLIDARSTDYDDGLRIPGAKFIPYDTKEELIRENLSDPKIPIIIYCTSAACPLSRYLAQRLFKLGYNNIEIYLAGFQEWQAFNYPLIKTKAGRISGLKNPE